VLAQLEEDEGPGQWAGATPPPLVRAEYAWLSAAKQGARAFIASCCGTAEERADMLGLQQSLFTC
jgi:hypothetical protein